MHIDDNLFDRLGAVIACFRYEEINKILYLFDHRLIIYPLSSEIAILRLLLKFHFTLQFKKYGDARIKD